MFSVAISSVTSPIFRHLKNSLCKEMVKNQNCHNSLKKKHPAFHIRSLPNVNLLKLFISRYLLLIKLYSESAPPVPSPSHPLPTRMGSHCKL